MALPGLTEVPVDAPMALWLADLSSTPCAEAIGWLGAVEVGRATRFHHARDRSRYLAAHVALRLVVDRCGGIAPQRQRYECDALGRWRLANQPEWRFSLSYAGERALIGVAGGHAIGVDIEVARPMGDADELAALHFDAAEGRAYQGRPDRAATHLFLRGWTRKEACLKAIGLGLRVAPASVHTGLDGPGEAAFGDDVIDLDSFEMHGLVAAWARVR